MASRSETTTFCCAVTPMGANSSSAPAAVPPSDTSSANGSGWSAKGFGKVTAIFGSVYNHVTGYFGDILSYSRLMTLMLAGSVIASVFNTLGAIPGNVVFFLIVSALGNGLNFALNLLSCYVHDLRLQCLEYFGKFYQDGGKPFEPLAINTKYVDIQS